MSNTLRHTVIAAAATASRFIGETLIAWADGSNEMLRAFDDSETGDYLIGRMECDGPDASDVSPQWLTDDPAAEVSDGLIPPTAPPIPAGSPTSPGHRLWHLIDTFNRQIAVLYRDVGLHHIADQLDPPK